MNALVGERKQFLRSFPARPEVVDGRGWEVIDTGSPAATGAAPTVGPNGGHDRVLVLLPGTLGKADVFWRIINRLPSDTRIIAVTYPATSNLEQWADDVLRLLDRRRIETAYFLGSSLGGYLAQWIAGTSGDRCAGLIAANTLDGVDMVKTVPRYAGDLERTPIAELRAGFETGLNRWAADHPEQADMVNLLLADVAGRISARHIRARLLALKTAPPLPEPSVVSSRIAVIDSADDPLIPPPIRDAVKARLKPTITHRFDWGGHFPYIVRPDDYAAVVTRCLEQQETK